MKVVTPKEMANVEAAAYRAGASESDFMEEAGSGIALIVHDLVEEQGQDRQIILLCGKGNNAGDAYVAGIQLLHLEYDVTAYQLFPSSDSSPLCKQNSARFHQEGGRIVEVSDSEELKLPESGVVIDGIFGTGFRGQLPVFLTPLIEKVNRAKLPIVAVDIPSGLNGETGEVGDTAIVASATGFLGLPKLGFFLNEGWNHIGKLFYVDFGLPQEYITEAQSEITMLSAKLMKPFFPSFKRNRHKYQAGLVVGLAGSPNMAGAAMLSSMSALHGGAGIVRLLFPEMMRQDLVASPYELIKIPYRYDQIDFLLNALKPAKAAFIGPGLSLSQEVRAMLKSLIPKLTTPAVLDADALTIIAEENLVPPPHSILTPHMGELKRLLQVEATPLNLPFLHLCKEFATDKQITLVVKGAPTFIFHPNEPIYVCPHGDPGMATAGSGDVLTGLIAALLAQGVSTHHAAMLGVYLHALAGEYAAKDLSSYFMTATDIMDYLPEAFLS